MKKLSIKLTLALLTFLVGVSVVSVTYFLVIESSSQQLISNVNKVVTVVLPIYENPCDYPETKHKLIEAKEAVHLAECFIIQNGYTKLPPIADKSKLTPENVFPMIDKEGLKMRHDSLERKAYSYRRTDYWGGSWEIMFRLIPHPEIKKHYGKHLDTTGRAVIMNYYGENLRIRHSGYPLITPNTKIINQ